MPGIVGLAAGPNLDELQVLQLPRSLGVVLKNGPHEQLVLLGQAAWAVASVVGFSN